MAAAAVILIGWWVYTEVKASLRERNAADLAAIVDAEAEFLRCMSASPATW